MKDNNLTVKELSEAEIPHIAEYWTASSDDHLVSMGVDLSKIPPKEGVINFLTEQINLDLKDRSSYALVWFIDGIPVGHCNVDQISFGEQANMHLHFWNNSTRKKGFGTILLRLSIPLFFEKLKLKVLISEPYAKNLAPNKTLPKLGFEFEKKHVCIPGSLCFEQEVNKWVLSKEKFSEMYSKNFF